MDPVEEIKSRLPIEDLVGRYVDLKRSGASLKGLCPFHQEKTPSFYVNPARGSYHCFGCIHEDEPIWTSSGLRRIGDVRVGDCVLDAFGCMQLVVAREPKAGSVLGIETDCFRRDPLRLTPDHTCLTVRQEDAIASVRRISRDAERGVNFYGRYGEYRQPRTATVVEANADTLRPGDFFLFPVIPVAHRRPAPLTAAGVIRTYTSGPRTARISGLPADEDCAWLYGLWLAEGSRGRGVVRLSLNFSERGTLAQRAVEILRDRFELPARIIEIPNHGLCEVTCCKTDLEHQLLHWFGRGAAAKRIPAEVLWWPQCLQRALLDGYLAGDGNQRWPLAATVSRELAYGLFAVAVQAGLAPSLVRFDAPNRSDGVARLPGWRFSLRGTESLAGFHEPINGVEYYWSQVRTVESLPGTHRVVDITVAESSTFVTKLGATHNCGKGGDVFSFLMETERLQFREALEQLAEQTGVRLPKREQARPSLKGKLFEANEAAAQFFADQLQSAAGRRAREYLSGRRFGEDAIRLFGLGYAPDSREALLSHLRSAGHEDRVLLSAGLVLQDDVAGRLRDRFRGRLMFPIRDASGRISGFGGRIFGDGQPKYLNSPQTEIFDKSGVLYGVHLAAEAMRKGGRAVLVEGYLDAVRAHLGGFAWTVASLGTAVTPAQLTTLSRLAPTVILALDPDPAGQSAAARTALTALAEVTKNRGRAEGQAGAVELRIAVLPADAGDPDELIRDDPARWQEVLDASIPAFDFYYDRTLQSLDRSGDAWRQEAIDRLLPLIQQFAESAGWQARWIERLARDTGIDPQALQRTMPAAGGRQSSRPRPRPAPSSQVATATTARGLVADPALGVEEALLALLLRLVVVPEEGRSKLTELRLERPEHQTLLAVILAWSETGNYEYELLRETIPEELHELADGLHGRNLPIPDDRRVPVAIAYHLARIDRFRLQAQLQRAGQTLSDIDPDSQPEAVASIGRLTANLHEVEQRLDAISRQMIQASTYA